MKRETNIDIVVGIMVEIVVGINLIGSGLYGGDRCEIYNFLKSKCCVCWFLVRIRLRVWNCRFWQRWRETDTYIDIDIDI